ncbi:LamB/YcsF family protein [Anaerophilus nitritogenes]|uniref:LamB/YcsF family protein n=1 Tax=Anaerophilus nitritogenes TaxID=2498136 RepID=UPI00101C7B9E|nr:5-oxoprolinase subunit PxpA [Anaerophilus nitritogenes]
MYTVDLNSDLGESFGNYKIGLDEEVIQYVTSANIACGWHAGDPLVMEKTVHMAKKENVRIGAHPGYPDLMGFGRRNITCSPKEVKAYVKYQLGALQAFTKSLGEKIQHVKPHGAMYNMAAKDYALAKAVAEAIYEVDENVILMGLANSALIKAAEEIGLKVANEVFADRAYNTDGTLVSRSLEGAVIHDTDVAIKRVIKMVKEGKVTAINGEEIHIKADSICVHGDNPKAVAFVKQIREKLEEEGVKVTAISNFIK